VAHDSQRQESQAVGRSWGEKVHAEVRSRCPCIILKAIKNWEEVKNILERSLFSCSMEID
jgi:hypothetical protein